MRLSEEDKKCIKILYRNGLNVKEIEKLLNSYYVLFQKRINKITFQKSQYNLTMKNNKTVKYILFRYYKIL